MAMQKIHTIKDTHSKAITALAYNHWKHEIVAGCEDGVIKMWECMGDTIGKLTRVTHAHSGWINCFLFWNDAKTMITAANDGKVIAWGSSMIPISTKKIGTPVFSMALNVCRMQIILGLKAGLRVHTLCDPTKDGKLLAEKPYVANDHTDIVKGIICHETRIYSAGLDQRICIYDGYAYPGKTGLKLVACLYPAHNAGITTIQLAKGNGNNTWLITGAFDKTVKVWSQDGQLLHKFDGLSSSVTSLCYVPPLRTIWVASGTVNPTIFDPKSGDNVSEFIGTFEHADSEQNHRNPVLLMQFINELNQVIATNQRREIVIWRYIATGCIVSLKQNNPVECLTYTKKVPILIFSSGNLGNITKWERMQSNSFMYSKGMLPRSEGIAKHASQLVEQYESGITGNIYSENEADDKKGHSMESNVGTIRLNFVEELDLLLLASEDNNVYVWGFDFEVVEILKGMKPFEDDASSKFKFLLTNSTVKNNVATCSAPCDSVTNRVAGFICKAVFSEHTDCVSGMAVVNRSAGHGSTYLITAGWDRRIFVWDLERLCLHDTFKNSDADNDFLASDGIINDIVYCEERNEFAYASCDKLVYIREFNVQANQMKLKTVLQGHEAEVTTIRWNHILKKWISGSEDCTIRVWSGDGMTCESVFSSHSIVSAMCIDSVNGCVVVGAQDTIRVYDIVAKSVVQINHGHTDVVRCIIHIPEQEEYVSASWDKTVKIWNAYKKNRHTKQTLIS